MITAGGTEDLHLILFLRIMEWFADMTELQHAHSINKLIAADPDIGSELNRGNICILRQRKRMR